MFQLGNPIEFGGGTRVRSVPIASGKESFEVVKVKGQKQVYAIKN
jgi:hypothetical protein